MGGPPSAHGGVEATRDGSGTGQGAMSKIKDEVTRE